MANTILIKRSATPGAVPGAGNLSAGELAINTSDGKLFFKDDTGNVKVIASIGSQTFAGNVTADNFITSGLVTATGNIQGGNINTGGIVSSTGNVIGGNIVTSGKANVGSVEATTTVSAGGNVTGGNIVTVGVVDTGSVTATTTVSATGNITGGNINTAGQISAIGNVAGNYFIGNGSQLTGINANSTLIVNGTSNVDIPVADGNIRATVNNSTVSVFHAGGVNVTGSASASGNVTGGNLVTAGVVTATGNITGGNILTAGTITSTGNVTAPNFIGNVIGNITGNITVGGNNTEVIFNDNGLANASAGFTFDKTSNLVTISGNLSAANIATAGSVNATGFISSQGNITGGNIATAGLITATGNITGANLITGGIVSASGSATVGNLATTGTASAGGNITGGNIATAGLITATGNITGGNIATAGLITITGNITGGNINTAGLVSATGNVTGGNIDTAGTVNTVTVVASSTISATGNITGGNILTVGSLSAGGSMIISGTGNSSIAGNLDMSSKNIINLATPVNSADAATKQYVDNLVSSGIHFHDPVRVESPVALNATYDNGTAGVGATLTNAGANAALVIDGISLTSNDRVLIYQQSDQTQNGVYVVTTIGDGATPWVLTRSADTDSYEPSTNQGLDEGSYFFVQEGNTGAGESYVCSVVGVITFGTTNITFAQFSSSQVYQAGTGLTLTNTTFSVNASQTQITAVGTLGSLSVTGNIVGGNVNTAGTLSSTANVIGGNISTAGAVSATGNITTAGLVSATGNITGANVNGTDIYKNGVTVLNANDTIDGGTY